MRMMNRSYRKLFEELEEKIQVVTQEQTHSLYEYATDVYSLNTQNKIKDYVNEVIKIINNLQEKKSDVNTGGVNKG